MQKIILNINPKAFFTPCAAHNSNLIVNNVNFITNFLVSFSSYVVFCSIISLARFLKKEIPSLTVLNMFLQQDWKAESKAFQLEKLYEYLFFLEGKGVYQ